MWQHGLRYQEDILLIAGYILVQWEIHNKLQYTENEILILFFPKYKYIGSELSK